MGDQDTDSNDSAQLRALNFQKVDALYRAHIDYVRHENELMHQRTTWFLAIQSVLLAGFGYLVLNYFESTALAVQGRPDEGIIKISEFLVEWFFIAIFGSASAFSASLSIGAADTAQQAIVRNWQRVKTECACSEPALEYYPGLLGGGDGRAGRLGGLLATSIAHVTLLFWLVALAIQLITSGAIIECYNDDPALFAKAEQKSAERDDKRR